MGERRPDVALLRFLLAGRDDTCVLNARDGRGRATAPADQTTSANGVRSQVDLAERLMRAARALLAGDVEAGYGSLAGSAAFAGYRALTRTLWQLDPAAISGRRARTAFWINLYNALVIDALISFAPRHSVREVSGFFNRAAYRIGPYRLSLDEIEHGILRGNQPRLGRLPPPFGEDDTRAALGPGGLDPRIHFALNCGARSCPPVASYEAARLDEQLDAAAASFVNGAGVTLAGDRMVLSPIFAFYAADFGGPRAAVECAIRYLDAPRLRERLERGDFAYGEYDWSLNATGVGTGTGTSEREEL